MFRFGYYKLQNMSHYKCYFYSNEGTLFLILLVITIVTVAIVTIHVRYGRYAITPNNNAVILISLFVHYNTYLNSKSLIPCKWKTIMLQRYRGIQIVTRLRFHLIFCLYQYSVFRLLVVTIIILYHCPNTLLNFILNCFYQRKIWYLKTLNKSQVVTNFVFNGYIYKCF